LAEGNAKELKRDLEFAVTQNAVAHSGGSATARTMAGMETWIASNKSNNTGGTTPTISSGTPTTAPTDGTQRAVTESMLTAVVKSAWDAGGEPSMVSVGSFIKQGMSNFAGVATQYRDNNQKGAGVIIGAMDIYVNFGVLRA
jgi:hypothetical protein